VGAETWIFDVDGCLIDSLTGSSLRPGARDLLTNLRARGCVVLVWSAGGADYACQRSTEQSMDHLIDGFHTKDGRDLDGRYRTDAFLGPLDDVVFVDDRPEDMPVAARVLAVSPYLVDDPHDRGFDRVLRQAVRG
jgi:long-chain acyl-CoA synthetase